MLIETEVKGAYTATLQAADIDNWSALATAKQKKGES